MFCTNADEVMKEKYDNYISLGYFCEVAQDLEKLGLRNQSSPFDWGISCFPGVIDAIDKEFYDFMAYDHLSQNVNIRERYREDNYHFCFFHDFSKYKTLDEQYIMVKEKYDRRIKRFLSAIKSPTLFVRYISSEELDENNKSIELNWIEKNYEYIIKTIRRSNPDNDIIFIGDETVKSDIIKIYMVPKDQNDCVSRSPIINNKELFPILSSVDFPGKEENINRYDKKAIERASFFARVKNKSLHMLRQRFVMEYKHTKTYM